MRVEASERAAYVQFVHAVSPRLLAVAWLLTGDGHRAEELVQESLVRVYVKWPTVEAATAPAYARKVLVNLHAEQWRRRRLEVLTETPPERMSDGVGAESVDLVRALQNLPPRERQAVVLRHYADLSEREAAVTMACSVGTVKSAASRGLARLRTLLSEGENHAVV